MLLEDYNYFINKAVQQYINKVYNRFDINQQSTDDLRVLQTATVLDLELDSSKQTVLDILSNTYICRLPGDYLHLLNCIVEYVNTGKGKNKCDEEGAKSYFPARRLTADMYPLVLTNAYMKPMYKRPYFYLHNVNEYPAVITNPSMDGDIMYSLNSDADTPAYDRTSNITNVILEIRYGNDSIYEATKVYVDYIKSPMFIRLSQSQIDAIVDTSQVLEFPDYVCFEIVNEFVKLLMENASDPRIQTNPMINQTIAMPGQDQQRK
jgi:hypothetical protein